MSRRKQIAPEIVEASKKFDPIVFAQTVRGDFADFPDPRTNEKRILYPVWYLALIVLCGFFCGCNTIEEIVEYTLLQEEWFRSILPQRTRSPSYGTIWWFLVRTPPNILKGYLHKWFLKIPGQLRDQLLALDGKRLKSANFMDGMTHVVELFATDDRLCLASEKVSDKTVEKSMLSSILGQVNVEGAIISADAHFTVSEVADKIVESKADYLLAVKENQPTLSDELRNFFDQADIIKWEGISHSYHETTEKDHGRIEIRRVHVIEDVEWIPEKFKWSKLSSLIRVQSIREKLLDGTVEASSRYYISSRRANAKNFGIWIRGHWGIENRCHWIADVIFGEDFAKADVGYTAENLALFRRLTMNIAAVTDPGRGLASVRRAAAFGPGYLKGILWKIFNVSTSNNFS